MNVIVVYETMFGNSAQLAHAIVRGLHPAHTTIFDVADAPTMIAPDIDLLVVGGPTHLRSMSRPWTRRAAMRRGGACTDLSIGIREWIGAIRTDGRPLIVAFDTSVQGRSKDATAARSATHLARRRGLRVARPVTFRVVNENGPLERGELERAQVWGASLIATAAPAG